MSKELEQKAEQLLIDMIEGATAASHFVIEQAPEVVEQLLLWHTVRSLVFFFIGVLLLVLGSLLLRKSWIEAKKGIYSNAPEVFFGMGIIPFFVGMLITLCSSQWLQILIAPKLYLLEYAAKLAG